MPPTDSFLDLSLIIPIAVLVLIFFASSVRVLREYDRGVMYTLGRFSGVSGPGIFFLIPYIQQMIRVDVRTLVHDVPPQDVISRDNVSVKVNAVLYYRVVDPGKAINQVQNYMAATSQLAQTTLRSVLGRHELDEMLSERQKLNTDIQAILDGQTEAWGIKVAMVEIKHIDIDESMIRAIAKQAEAERIRRAKIINAEGEWQAAERLVDAARTLAGEPRAMDLRYLSAIQEVANNRTSTILFPLPVDLLSVLSGRAGTAAAPGLSLSPVSVPPVSAPPVSVPPG